MPSKKSQTKKLVRVAATAKGTVKERLDAGGVIETNAPNSPIYQQNPDVKQAHVNLVGVNTKLGDKDAKVKALATDLGKERGARANLTVDWDGKYDVYVSTARIYCLTDEDAKGLGLDAAGTAIHALAMPLAVTARWDAKNALFRIRVKRPAGLRTVRIEISPDPVTPTSWKALEGDGATAALSGYAPGTYWVRAAMVRAREQSEFTVPVSVVVGT